MLCDYHVHTTYSDDGKSTMEEVVKSAVKEGIQELCFTDHVDYGVKLDHGEVIRKEMANKYLEHNVDYPRYVEEIIYLQKKYQDVITIKMGLEFGMQRHTIQKFETLFQRYPFDFIILSCHQVEDKEFWNQDFQKGKTQQEYNERYYEELLYVVKHFKDYSVLGHLDMIVRYDESGIYPFGKVKGIIEAILKEVIKDGKGIEVNTSSSRYGLSDLTPSRDILKLYKQLGGNIITIGSDAHSAKDIGADIQNNKQELKRLGFNVYCTYEKMKPIFHPLED